MNRNEWMEWYTNVYLRSEHWAWVRSRALARANGECVQCGCADWLHVHHKHYRTLWKESDDDVEALCLICHKLSHNKPITWESSAMARMDRRRRMNSDAELVRECWGEDIE